MLISSTKANKIKTVSTFIVDRHYSGELTIEDALRDPLYDISIKAVKLKKRVQMYQVRVDLDVCIQLLNCIERHYRISIVHIFECG